MRQLRQRQQVIGARLHFLCARVLQRGLRGEDVDDRADALAIARGGDVGRLLRAGEEVAARTSARGARARSAAARAPARAGRSMVAWAMSASTACVVSSVATVAGSSPKSRRAVAGRPIVVASVPSSVRRVPSMVSYVSCA